MLPPIFPVIPKQQKGFNVLVILFPRSIDLQAVGAQSYEIALVQNCRESIYGGKLGEEPDDATKQRIIGLWQKFKESNEKIRKIEDAENEVEENDNLEVSQLPDLPALPGPTDEFQRMSRTTVKNASKKYREDDTIPDPDIVEGPLPPTLEYTQEQLSKAYGWITANREEEFTKTPPRIDINQMTYLQRYAYNIVEHHMQEDKQLLMLLLGTAGTGKSFTISGIFHMIQELCGEGTIFLTATTGKAANLIQGRTFHGADVLSIIPKHFAPLSVKSLERKQEIWTGVRLLVIDEFSMLSAEVLYKIDYRLREIFAEDGGHQPFGGMSILLVGDLGQLPPVGGTTLFGSSYKSDANTGILLYDLFRTVVRLTETKRQEGGEFLDFLLQKKSREPPHTIVYSS